MSEPLRSLHVPWIAATVDGPYPFRVCDWARDYSFHRSFADARAALDAAAVAQVAFAAEGLVDVSAGCCSSCGSPLLVEVASRRSRCPGCGLPPGLGVPEPSTGLGLRAFVERWVP